MENRNLKHTSHFAHYLIGRKIMGIRYLEQAEVDTIGWYKAPAVLILDDETQIILQSDDEGNDGGAAWVYNPKRILTRLFTHFNHYYYEKHNKTHT